jgi:flagellar motor switch protein FliG
MSTLGRFRKPGGFQQLLILIETCDPSKQKNLLHLIGTEDPGWAHLVKMKALTFERIMSWPVEVLMEITPPLPDPILANAYKMAQLISTPEKPELHEKWLKCIPSIKAKEVQELASYTPLTPADQAASVVKLLQTIRELEAKGHIRFSNFDPTLEIDTRLTA